MRPILSRAAFFFKLSNGGCHSLNIRGILYPYIGQCRLTGNDIQPSEDQSRHPLSAIYLAWFPTANVPAFRASGNLNFH